MPEPFRGGTELHDYQAIKKSWEEPSNYERKPSVSVRVGSTEASGAAPQVGVMSFGQHVTGFGNGVDRFGGFLNGFGGHVEKFGNHVAAIPSALELTGNYRLDVEVGGLEFLPSLEPAMRQVAGQVVGNAIDDIKNRLRELGPSMM